MDAYNGGGFSPLYTIIRMIYQSRFDARVQMYFYQREPQVLAFYWQQSLEVKSLRV